MNGLTDVTTPIDDLITAPRLAAPSAPAARVWSPQGRIAYFSDLTIDLAEVLREYEKASPRPFEIYVFADVLSVPPMMRLYFERGTLHLFVRRIEAGAGSQLRFDFDASTETEVYLFVQEPAPAFPMVGFWYENGILRELALPLEPMANGQGLQLRWGSSAPEIKRPALAAVLGKAAPTIWHNALSQFFIEAIFQAERDNLADLRSARAIARWVKDGCAPYSALAELFWASTSLVLSFSSRIDAMERGAVFVPSLAKDLYEGIATAFFAEAQAFEARYRALSLHQTITDQAIADAKALLQSKVLESDYLATICTQEHLSAEQAEKAVRAAKDKFNLARTEMDRAAMDFENLGIPAWKAKKILQAVIDISLSVVTLGVGIGSMFVGNAGGGGQATAGAVQAATSAAQAANSAAETASTAKSMIELIKAIAEILENLQEVYQLAVQLSSAVSSGDTLFASLETIQALPSGEDALLLSATAQWDIFQLNANHAFVTPLKEEVDYAAELKLAVDHVVVYGRALAAAQAASISAAQAYATAKMRLLLAKAQEKELQTYIDQLTVGSAPTIGMMQLFYRRYLDLKSAIHSAIEDYRAAYYYWALRPSSVHAPISGPVSGLEAGFGLVSSLKLDETAALSQLKPPPQLIQNMHLDVVGPSVTEGLKTGRTISFAFEPSHPDLNGLERLRLSALRVYLLGLTVADGDARLVRLTIRNHGAMQDRFAGQTLQFVCEPIVRSFRYSLHKGQQPGAHHHFANGTSAIIQIDGIIDPDFAAGHLPPSVFGQWEVTVEQGLDQADLAQVTGISFMMEGSAIVVPGSKWALRLAAGA